MNVVLCRCGLLLFLAIVFVTVANAQLDSLQRALDQASTWKDKINAHQDLAAYYTTADSSQVMQHIDAMLKIAEQERDDLSVYQAYTSLASFYTRTSQYELAVHAMNQVYQASLKMDEPEKTSAVLGNIGVLKYYLNDIDSAQYFLDTAYQIKRTLPEVDSSNLARNLNSLAVISSELNQYKKALIYQTEALKITQSINDQSTYLRSLNGIASIYTDLNEPEKALEYQMRAYRKGLELDDMEAAGVAARNMGMKYMDRDELDSSVYYLREALKHFEKIGYQRGITEANISLGDWSVESKQLGQSIPYYQRAISYAEQISDMRLLANAQKNLGLVYLETKDYSRALALLENGLELYDRLNNSFGLKESYLALNNYHEQNNNWKQAHYYTTQYKILSDSLDQEKLNKEVKALQIKYETELKDSEIKRQNLVIENQRTKQRLTSGISFAGLLSLLAGGLAFWYRTKKNKLLSQQDLALKSAKILELQKEKKIMAMSSMIEGQEAERTRIAQDLHDGLGGLLSSVKLRLSNIDKQVKEIESYNIYERTTEIVDEACSEVRRISHNLVPGALRLEGLKSAVELLSQELSDVHGLQLKTEIYGFEQMKDDTKAIFIYRVIQEATNNIIKYAQASTVLIQLFESDSQYQLLIEDDGVGFDVTQESKGLGMRSMASRVEYLKGELEIDSVMNEGTTINIIIPKEKRS